MEDSEYDNEWDWGECPRDYVDNFLNSQTDGTFLVFHTGDTAHLTLAVRVNGENKFVRIYHQDELFGFIEPLSFDTLADALDAYNWSPIDTGNTLIFAGSKPDAQLQRSLSRRSLSCLYGANPVTILKRLRRTACKKADMGAELETVMEKTKTLEDKIHDLTCSLESLSRLIKILEANKTRNSGISLRASVSSVEQANAFASNNQKLKMRSAELSQEKDKLMEQKASMEQEKIEIGTQHTLLYSDMNQLDREISELKSSLLKKNNDFGPFLDCLLCADPSLLFVAVPLDIDKSTAERILKSNVNGTFLVRLKRNNSEKPFVVSVCFEGKIHHVPVLKLDDVFGFDANTCIFESIHELVNHYAIVSFSIHDQKYGDLKLTEQRLN